MWPDRRRCCRDGRSQRRAGRRATDRERLPRAAGRRGAGRSSRHGDGRHRAAARAAPEARTGVARSRMGAAPRGSRRRTWTTSRRARGRITLDAQVDRALARQVAEQSVVLLRNDGTLPLTGTAGKRVLVVGPTAEDQLTLLGCYSFPSHVGSLHPDVPIGIRSRPCWRRSAEELPGSEITYLQGVSSGW